MRKRNKSYFFLWVLGLLAILFSISPSLISLTRTWAFPTGPDDIGPPPDAGEPCWKEGPNGWQFPACYTIPTEPPDTPAPTPSDSPQPDEDADEENDGAQPGQPTLNPPMTVEMSSPAGGCSLNKNL